MKARAAGLCLAVWMCSSPPLWAKYRDAQCNWRPFGPEPRDWPPNPSQCSLEPTQQHPFAHGAISARFLAHRVPKGACKEFDLGYKAWRRSQFNEPQPHFAEAVRLDPSFLEALTGLAVVHLKLRQSELALNNLKGALALEPDWATLHSNKASALMMLDRPGEAEQAAAGPYSLIRAGSRLVTCWRSHVDAGQEDAGCG
jgi:hypothetical protein